MDDQDLIRLMHDMESQRVERKPSERQSDSICKAICAFANDLPGYKNAGVVFVGLNDDGSCANLAVTDSLLRSLADMRSSGNILPLPRMLVERRVLDGCELAIVIVHPSDAPPVRYKGTTYVRVSGSNRVASEADIRALSEKRRSRDLPFDLHPLSTATIADLDMEWFANEYVPAAVGAEELRANDRAGEAKLASLRFVSLPPESLPTVLGVLVCGFDPRSIIPGAYVQFLRFEGTEITDPIKDQREISGKVSQVLGELDDAIKAHISTSSDFTSGTTEIKHPDYPLPALQQIVRNAILHRTYDATNAPARVYWFSDRIEVQNPGGPYGQVTPENFGDPGVTDYRNPYLAEALKNLGYVQRFGLGIQIAQQELAKNGNPDLDFAIETSHVLVTVRRRP